MIWICCFRAIRFTRHSMSLSGSVTNPIGGNAHPVDHLPTLIRKTGWEWRGNYFDPELPPALELHFRLWDASMEGFAIPCIDDFWERRERRALEDVEFTSLAAIDLPGYAAAHALRHMLRGDLRPSHIYEIAYFLEHNNDPNSGAPGAIRTINHYGVCRRSASKSPANGLAANYPARPKKR